MKYKTLILLPLLMLACTLTAALPVTPTPYQGRRAAMVATVQPTERTATATPLPAPRVCQVKTNIEAGALNLRACGATSCPVVIVLREAKR